MPPANQATAGPKISVLLAVYNGEEFLRNAIESIQAQDFVNWELIIVDNGSNDETATIASSLSSDDPRIRVFSMREKNKNKAYNLAFEKATGDYICFFAADDVLPANSLRERVAVLLDKGPSAFSTCCLRTVSDDPKYDGLVFPRKTTEPNYSGGSLFFPRSLARQIFPLPPNQPNEDTWASLHLRALGENHHVPRPLYQYRIHGNNSYGYGTAFADKRARYLSRMNAYRLFYEKYRGKDLPFMASEVAPFLEGLNAAQDMSVSRILRVKGLGVGTKLVFLLYSSPLLYKIRNTYFRTFSGGVTG